VPAFQQPEAYIGGADKLFDAAGKLSNPSTREFLGKFMQTFAGWVALHVAR
jgi:chromate reductase